MMKLKRKAGLGAGVLAGVAMLIAPAAFAANTASVDGTASPVGDVAVTGTNVGTLLFATDVPPVVPMSCTTSSMTGLVKRGAVVTTGATIGKITSIVFGSSPSCTMTTLNYPFRLEKTPGGTKGLPIPDEWPIVATTTPAKGAAIMPIRIDNIDLKLQSVTKTGTPASYVCDLRIRGSLTGVFNQVTQQITIAPPAGTYSLNNLEAYDGSGNNVVGSGQTCAGWIWTGDSMRMTGAFRLTTPLGGGIHW